MEEKRVTQTSKWNAQMNAIIKIIINEEKF